MLKILDVKEVSEVNEASEQKKEILVQIYNFPAFVVSSFEELVDIILGDFSGNVSPELALAKV